MLHLETLSHSVTAEKLEKVCVVLDTDIGSNIDDALALSYLLAQSKCELLGVTTVSGEPERRAAIVDAMCRAAGRTDIPIHVGRAEPMKAAQKQPHAPHFSALEGKWPHSAFATECTARAFLSKTIRSRPHEVLLLTIGPMTNVADLMVEEPDIPMLLRGIITMGGRYYGGSPEWNMRCDPTSAAIVLKSAVPVVTLVGLDVTLKCVLRMQECRTRLGAARDALAVVNSMADVWFQAKNIINFHDPLAAASIFLPELIKTVSANVSVDVSTSDDEGATTIEEHADSNVHVAYSVDPELFFGHYFSVVGASSSIV